MTGIHKLGVVLVVISNLLVCLSVCLVCGIYVWMGVSVFLMLFVYGWVCVCASSCSVWYQSNCGESEETIVLLPCSCCCVVLLSECAVILGPNVCVCVCVCVCVSRAGHSCDC